MADRVDGSGAAYAGSQLQTQLWVNRRPRELAEAVGAELPALAGSEIEWRSPLATESHAEYWDDAFLDRLDLGAHKAQLREFWPRGGPHWDGLAVVPSEGGRPAVLLLEGKSYPGELYGSGCQAAPGSASRVQIEQSLGWTQEHLGVTDRSPEDWCGPLYQSANRLAHVYWLRSLGVRAWFAHLLFVDDPHRPTTAMEWSAAFRKADAELGVTGINIEATAHVLLPAGTRDQLLDDAR